MAQSPWFQVPELLRLDEMVPGVVKKREEEPYVVPDVWEDKTTCFGRRNSNAISGALFEKKLQVGEHKYQLYTLGTPSGSKVTILLEEIHDLTGLEYDGWFVSFADNDQHGSEFVEVNPNSRIPVLVDHDLDPPLRVFESSNIMRYVAEKARFFLPADHRDKVECYNWLFWGHAATSVFANFAHCFQQQPNVKYAVDYWTIQAKRLLDVLDRRLDGRTYVCGDEYTVADMAIFPVVRLLLIQGKFEKFLQIRASYTHIPPWYTKVHNRAAVRRGLRVAGFGHDSVKDRHKKADFILR